MFPPILDNAEVEFLSWGAGGMVALNVGLLGLIYRHMAARVTRNELAGAVVAQRLDDLRAGHDLLEATVRDGDTGVLASLREIRASIEALDEKNDKRHADAEERQAARQQALWDRLHQMNDQTQRAIAERLWGTRE